MSNKWRPGDYLIIDELTGEEHWASDVGYDWDGSIRHKDDFDGMHPEYAKRIYPLEKFPSMVNAPPPDPYNLPIEVSGFKSGWDQESIAEYTPIPPIIINATVSNFKYGWTGEETLAISDELIREAVMPPTTIKAYYVATWGSDSNDGRSWKTAMLTPEAGHAKLTGNSGDLYFSRGSFNVADTVVFGQSQRWHGWHWHLEGGGGTELVWTGADDGRHMLSFTGSTDSTKQVFENFRISGPTMTGGGTAVYLEDLQNGSVIENIHVSPWSGGPSFKLVDNNSASVNYPGYVTMRNCWGAGNSTYGFHIESGTTGILLDTCACDSGSTGQLAAFLLRQKRETAVAVTSCSQSGSTATFVAPGHGLAAGGGLFHTRGITPDGYNGMWRASSSSGDNVVATLNRTGLGVGTVFGTLERLRSGTRGNITMINCKSEAANLSIPCIHGETNQQLILIGFTSRVTTDSGTEPFIKWDGPKYDDVSGGLQITPPLSAMGCNAQNRDTLLKADRFGPDNGTFEIINESASSGRSILFNFTPAFSYAPCLSFIPMAQPPDAEAGSKRIFLDSATGKLSAVNDAGVVTLLEP